VDFRRRALELAERAIGRTSPNPPVGAVVVRDGAIVGEGYTRPAGQAHAEVVALAAAGTRADGADLYVTLEPCCHHGRTPPCTDAIVAAGVRRVYVAAVDPYPAVNGGGIAALRRAGIATIVETGDPDVERLNRPFFHFVRAGRPFVTAKWAMTLDGKIASRSGDSRWVSGEAARRLVHRERDAADAIAVGIGTVLADDPALTVRLDPADDVRPARPAPLRVVFDSRARTPLDCRLIRENDDRRTLILVGEDAPEHLGARLRQAGVEVLRCRTRESRIDPADALARLGRLGVVRLLLEGGAELTGAFFDDRLVDRVLAFVAPKVVGGREAPSPVEGEGRSRMGEAIGLEDVRFFGVGNDLALDGYPRYSEVPSGSPGVEALAGTAPDDISTLGAAAGRIQ
jgi:diaminohydroxyphosphoribosylaminopyrimidine deaminase/5-amino-6-(5-phosphoribosylamino)uracil reductase